MDWSRFAVGGAADRPDSFTGLNPDFAQGVYGLVNAAHQAGIPLQITSAYRSPEVQARLYDAALEKYGSPEKARKWVAPPGRSQHNAGMAVDFALNGNLIRDPQSPAAKWLRENAANYGLSVPMDWEPWQVELMGARGAAQQTTGGNMQPQGLLGTVSTQGQEPEQLPFFQRPETANLLDTLAIGFSGMTLNPNQALIQSAQERIKGRRESAQTAQQRNATAAWLESQGLAQLADGVRSGAITGAQAMDMAKGTTQDPYSTIGKLQADLAAGRISPEQYQIALQSMAPSGMAIDIGPDGQVRVVQGPGVQGKPLTEGQSKDTVYATRAEGALPTLDQYESALTGIGDIALGADPTGLVRGRLQSTEYQLARQAGDEFLQAVLRKDTGAAITAQEQALYGKTYLPEPGDGPDLIAQKRQARRRALEAIKAGLPPSAIVAQERALQESGAETEKPPSAGGAPRIRYDANGNRIQ